MIDTDLRLHIADTVARFLDGSVDNWTLDDAAFSKPTEDRLCREIAGQLWLFYDDTRRYKNQGPDRLPVESDALLRRWESLLRMGLEWSLIVQDSDSQAHWAVFSRILRWLRSRRASRCKFAKNIYWPLRDAGDWDRIRALASDRQ